MPSGDEIGGWTGQWTRIESDMLIFQDIQAASMFDIVGM